MKRIVFWNCGGTGNMGDDLCHLGAVRFAERRWGAPAHMKRIFLLNEATVLDVIESDLLLIGGGALLEPDSDFLARLDKHGTGETPFAFAGIGVSDCDAVREIVPKLKPLFWHVRNKESGRILLANRPQATVELGDDLSNLVEIQPWHGSEWRCGALALKAVGKSTAFAAELAKELNQVEEPVALLALNSRPRTEVDIDGERAFVSDCDDTVLGRKVAMLSESRYRREIVAYDHELHRPEVWAGMLGGYQYMVVERLHAAILAHRFRIPFRGVGSSDKVKRFMQDVGMADRIIGGTPSEIVAGLLAARGEAQTVEAMAR